MSATRLFLADYVVTMTGAPIQNGAIAVRDDQIINIGTHKLISEYYRNAEKVTLEGHVIMPALVNAHSHTALTDSAGLVPHREFLDWLLALIPWMRKQTPDSFYRSAINGLRGMYESGITTIGDSFYILEPMRAALELDFRCVFFFEVFGVSAFIQLFTLFKYSRALFNGLQMQTRNTRIGISPHAPYTVTPSVLRFASKFSETRNVIVSMHVAETSGELEFLGSLKGRFRQQFEPSGRKIPTTTNKPLEYIDSFGVVNERFIAVHGVHLTDTEFELLAKRKGNLVSCPSSNKNLETGWLDVTRPINAGVNVCIGTDSPASSDGIDLFNELRLALKIGGDGEIKMNARDALSLITVNPAKALGFIDQIGTIETGKFADLIAINLPKQEIITIDNLESLIVRKASPRDISLTVSSGKIKHSKVDNIPCEVD